MEPVDLPRSEERRRNLQSTWQPSISLSSVRDVVDDFPQRHHEAPPTVRRDWDISIRRGTDRPDALHGEKSATELLLVFLRIVKHYNIAMFPHKRDEYWGHPTQLGLGVSNAVEGGELPVLRAVRLDRYRRKNANLSFYNKRFQDHMGVSWTPDSQVAFKFPVHSGETRQSLRERVLRECIRDLRLLSHPPLAKHPNIVKLLGVVWFDEKFSLKTEPIPPETEPAAEPFLLPALLLELAPHGSLLDFLKSDRTNQPLISTKLRLCYDVLGGIAALHSCGMVHGDIKCQNVLVFNTLEDGSADGWKAKITDFSFSVSSLNDADRDGRLDQPIHGTRLYRPPELDERDLHLTAKEAQAVDVWCWGMILWQVMITGLPSPEERDTLEEETIVELRKNDCDELQRVAINSIRRNYPDSTPEFGLINFVCSLIQETLVRDPLSRPTIDNLQLKFQTMMPYLRLNAPAIPSLVHDLRYMSQFDLSESWNELVGYKALHVPIFQELLRLSDLKEESGMRARVQVALCNLTGFGCRENHQQGLDLMLEAASSGCAQAKGIVRRLHYSSRKPHNKDHAVITEWLSDAMRSGSRIACQDLHDCYPGTFKAVKSELIAASRKNLERCLFAFIEGTCKDNNLCPDEMALFHEFPNGEAILNDLLALEQSSRFNSALQKCWEQILGILSARDENGNTPLLTACTTADYQLARYLIVKGAGIRTPGSCGETPSHLLVNFDDPTEACDLARMLADGGADLRQRTTADYAFSPRDHFPATIPAFSTPLLWAISDDYLPLAEQLFGYIATDDEFEQVVAELLAWAAQHQSLNCLRWLCKRNDLQNMITLEDGMKNLPLFYALLPDRVKRILSCRPSRTPEDISSFALQSDSKYSGTEQLNSPNFGQGPTHIHDMEPKAQSSNPSISKTHHLASSLSATDTLDVARQRERLVISILLSDHNGIRYQYKQQPTFLHQAAAVGDASLLDWLLYNFVPDIQPYSGPDDGGMTPVDLAMANSDLTTFSILLKARASLAKPNGPLQTHCIHHISRMPYAMAKEFAEVVFEIDKDAISAKDIRGKTALHWAIIVGNIRYASFLLDKKNADPYAADINGITPLGSAIQYGSRTGVCLFIKKHKESHFPLVAQYRKPASGHILGYFGALVFPLTGLRNSDVNLPLYKGTKRLVTQVRSGLGLAASLTDTAATRKFDYSNPQPLRRLIGFGDHYDSETPNFPLCSVSRLILRDLFDASLTQKRPTWATNLKSILCKSLTTPDRICDVRFIVQDQMSMTTLCTEHVFDNNLSDGNVPDCNAGNGVRDDIPPDDIWSLVLCALQHYVYPTIPDTEPMEKKANIRYLGEVYKASFVRLHRERQQKIGLIGFFWRLYYQVYENAAHDQKKAFLDWRLNHRLGEGPKFFEAFFFRDFTFDRWSRVKILGYSLPFYSFLIFCAVGRPNLSKDSSGKRHTATIIAIIYNIISLIIMSPIIWPLIPVLLHVLFHPLLRRRRRDYHDSDLYVFYGVCICLYLVYMASSIACAKLVGRMWGSEPGIGLSIYFWISSPLVGILLSAVCIWRLFKWQRKRAAHQADRENCP